MERSSIDQATDLLGRSMRVLLIVPAEPSPDAFASMVALSLALEAFGREVTMVSASHVPGALQFLPGTSQVKEWIERTRELIIDVPLENVRPADVRWEQKDGMLRFVITPERGKTFEAPTPFVMTGTYSWDTIVTIGSPDLNHLGAPFTEHAPFFYQTPIINIDHGTANEFFGAVNLVSATAGTVGEVVYDLIDALGGVNLMTPEVATCLYAALLTGTHSFQSPHTTPRTFTIASVLLEQEADRQTVTRNLFATHTLPELRILGRALARLREGDRKILWSVLSQRDFSESEGTSDLLPAVVKEIVERAGETIPVTVAYEQTTGVLEALLAPGRMSTEDRQSIASRLGGSVDGSFIRVSLGTRPAADAETVLKEKVFPAIPARDL